ncbi:MAG TPA: hypothetical protein VHK47_07430 [Polyangia bacterium]|jgi:hypothetical protein|nr:hypothetical protein [Polyangia bacterium]
MEESTQESPSFDPTRKLCPDGSCVGVIDANGVCSECGRTEAQAEAGAEAPSVFGATPEGAPSGEGGFDANRRLCDDGACVGVVGDDGTCRVCGRRAE